MKNRKDMENIINEALDILELPRFVTFDEIKRRYKDLSRKYHPDLATDEKSDKILKINSAYEILKDYIKNFRYSFDKEEINKQYPEDFHANRFRF